MKAKGLAVFGAVLLAAIALLVHLNHRADLIAQQTEQLRIANQIAQDAAAIAAFERDLEVRRESLNSLLSESADRVRDLQQKSAEQRQQSIDWHRDFQQRSAERRQRSIEMEKLAEMRRANEIADQFQQTLERAERNSRNNALRIR